MSQSTKPIKASNKTIVTPTVAAPKITLAPSSAAQRPIRMDSYSRHPLRGPLYPAHTVIGSPGATFMPIDPSEHPASAYRSARLNERSPFINVHPRQAIDGRIPPRRPRMPLNFRATTLPGGALPSGPHNRAVDGSRQQPVGTRMGAGDHLWSQASVLIVNPMHMVNLSEHTKSKLIRIIETLKRFSEKWFSHVLLLLFLAIYACLGAYIFISFEAPKERYEKQMIIDMRMKIVNDSWNARERLKPAYFELLRMRFEEYEHLLNNACAMGMSSFSLDSQWTFWGALFYSMTVFTTIGYGHLTPATFAGRIATMIYAIFGIPILLMVLADLGKLLTRVIKYGFNKLRLMFWRLFRKKGAQKTRKMISDNTNQYIGVAKGAFEKGFAYIPYVPQALRSNSFKSTKQTTKLEPTLPEGENQTTSVIVTTSAPSPAVSPDVEPHQTTPSSKRANLTNKARKGRRDSINGKHHSSANNSNNNSKEDTFEGEIAKTSSSDDGATQNKIPLELSNAIQSPIDNQPIDPASLPDAPAFEDIDDEFDLPVSVALTLLVMYMMFGAIIFSAWEGWNFFDSLYFVFISMSTIGFGDLVPQHPKRMMATFIYLLFGLALTSMCINVVQEKIHATFLRAKMQIGEKMGLDLEQIMADDCYADGCYDEDYDSSCQDGNDTDENNVNNNNKLVGLSRQSSSNTHSEPSSANNSIKGRKKSSNSLSGKEEKRKISTSATQSSGGHDQSATGTQINQQKNRNLNKSKQDDKQQPIITNNNNKSNTKPNTQWQSASIGDHGKRAASNINDNDPSKIKQATNKQKSLLQDKPVINQLEEPMPPTRSRWGSGKYSDV